MKARERDVDGLPWWMFAAVALIAVEFHEQLLTSGPTSLSGSQAVVDEQPPAVQRRPPGLLLRGDMERRLAKATSEEQKKEEPTEKAAAKEDRNLKAGKLNFFVQIPCLRRPTLPSFHMVQMIKPCGNISVGLHTVEIETPFGTQYLPGANDIKPQVKQTEEFMSRYTVYIVIVLAIIYAIHKITVDRKAMMTSLADMRAGRLDNDDDMTEDEKAEEKKQQMDPNSEDFIAPGNIYRCLACFHPGLIGYSRWSAMAFKALVSAYMQLYLPKKIIFAILSDWKVLGVKSPLWFLGNASVFVSMMAALLSLCNMFAGKCIQNIMAGAQANFYIMAHDRDPAVARPPPAADPAADSPGYVALPQLPKVPPPSHMFIMANEYFWCCLSMFVNVGMSFMLQLAMFLKVATFSGKIEHVAVVAVSLYFVFELDKKVLEADPKLKAKYRKEVLEMTVLRDYQPTWINSLPLLSIALLRATIPVGMLLIVLVSWKNAELGIVIGGDGLTRK